MGKTTCRLTKEASRRLDATSSKMSGGAFLYALFILMLLPGSYLSLGSSTSPIPTRPTSAFPPRPSYPSPTPTTLPGAGIELRVHATRTGLWSIVQWQDGLGGWHDVEGWQSGLDDRNRQVWWVAPKDMGTGPFRWLVLAGEGGTTLAISEPFYLPTAPGQLLVIEVTPTEAARPVGAPARRGTT